MKIILAAASLLFLLPGCVQQATTKPDEVELNPVEQHTANGYNLLVNKNAFGAIDEFDKAIALCEKKHSTSDKQIFAARSTTETLFYLTKAVSENKAAVVENTACSDAYYHKGYIYIELRHTNDAEKLIKKAIELSPNNALYLSELGHIFHIRKDWKTALEIFTRAEKAAETFTPENLKSFELARAKRGIGYSLIELKDYDRAIEKYNECLAIDENDKAALRELEYIKSIRGKAK